MFSVVGEIDDMFNKKTEYFQMLRVPRGDEQYCIFLQAAMRKSVANVEFGQCLPPSFSPACLLGRLPVQDCTALQSGVGFQVKS
jgi:hypothetical protein